MRSCLAPRGTMELKITLNFSLWAFFTFLLVLFLPHHGILQVSGKQIGIKPGPVVLATRGEVWPKPQRQIYHRGHLIVRPSNFTFKVVNQNCDILKDAIQRYAKIIKTQEKKRRMMKRGNIDTRRELSLTAQGTLEALTIDLMKPCEALPQLFMDEKYELRVNSPDQPNKALLAATSIWGILRGLETFSQLLYIQDSSAIIVNSTSIMDHPRFPHRGLLLDTSRHYLPLKIIYQTLDAMAMNKFNVFHWHIVDDHSFPFVSTTFSRLSEYGAYSPKHVYTPNDVKNIIKYATYRGIRVLPEFDTPGHTRSWGEGYPELLTTCYGSSNLPDGSLGPMNPIANATYDFMNKFLNEIKNVFPDKFFHVGGDEVDYECWISNPDINKYAKEHNITFSKLEEMYVKKIIDTAYAKSLKTIVWQEVFDNGLNVPKDTIIHVWKVQKFWEELETVTSMGFTALLSSPWYLDHTSTGGDWIKYYNLDPYDFTGNDDQKKKLLGGEACMWGEHVDATNVMTRVWPRASAAAEKLWSAANRNYQQAAKRLEEHVCRMNMRGIVAQPANGPGYCPYVNF